MDVTSKVGDPEQKVRKDSAPLQCQRSELGIPPPKEACPLGAGTRKVHLNPGSGSVDPVGGTKTPTASIAYADHVHDKLTLKKPSVKAIPVKSQTCATMQATTTKFTNVETQRGAAERMTKPAVGSKDNSNPYSLEGAVQCISNLAVLGGKA
jgi:hypothetical protein